jgi:hypothetical protein
VRPFGGGLRSVDGGAGAEGGGKLVINRERATGFVEQSIDGGGGPFRRHACSGRYARHDAFSGRASGRAAPGAPRFDERVCTVCCTRWDSRRAPTLSRPLRGSPPVVTFGKSLRLDFSHFDERRTRLRQSTMPPLRSVSNRSRGICEVAPR